MPIGCKTATAEKPLASATPSEIPIEIEIRRRAKNARCRIAVAGCKQTVRIESYSSFPVGLRDEEGGEN